MVSKKQTTSTRKEIKSKGKAEEKKIKKKKKSECKKIECKCLSI